MAFKKLQLNLLSQSGELINCVSCHAGQVSVFRAPTYSALEVYQRALAGIPGRERISIFLDDRTYIPSEHYFVGFGESQEAAHEPVLESFFRLGLNGNIIDGLCSSYDLKLTPQTSWNKLSKCEARRVRLLIATRTKDQILILNDPFEPLANQWRERFAELLSSFARTNKEIVVVTNLTYRPESWIDNPSIARIQVGEEIQRTIGFGANAGQGNELVKQIREMMKDEAKAQQFLSTPAAVAAATAAPSAIVAAPKTIAPKPVEELSAEIIPEDDDTSRRMTLAFSAGAGIASRFDFRKSLAPLVGGAGQVLRNPITSALLAGSVILGGSVYLLSTDTDEAPQTASIQEPPETKIVKTADNNTAKKANIEPAAEKAVVEAPPEVPEQKMARLVLDEYPAQIKDSILLSFQGIGRASIGGTEPGAAQNSSSPANTTKSGEAGDLLKLLATASDTGEGLPDSAPVYDTTDDAPVQNAPTYNSEEEKREAIRKRFLEAIERAQNMRRIQQE